MSRLQTLRESFAELGPLRWVIAASAVLPTIGICVLLANLAALAAAWPVHAVGVAAAIAALALGTGALLLPPSMSAVAAGYVFGAVPGAGIAAVAIAIGGVLGECLVWPRVGARLIPFMQGRPRLEAVRLACAVAMPAQALRVAVVRGAARVPFCVVNLLFAAAGVRAVAVFVGTLLWALPLASLLAAVGAAWRHWRDHGELPGAGGLAGLGLAAAVAAAAGLAARRAFVRLTTR